jgi:hypothetical protein
MQTRANQRGNPDPRCAINLRWNLHPLVPVFATRAEDAVRIHEPSRPGSAEQLNKASPSPIRPWSISAPNSICLALKGFRSAPAGCSQRRKAPGSTSRRLSRIERGPLHRPVDHAGAPHRSVSFRYTNSLVRRLSAAASLQLCSLHIYNEACLPVDRRCQRKRFSPPFGRYCGRWRDLQSRQACPTERSTK